jgi:UDP-glucose 4-epimerase
MLFFRDKTVLVTGGAGFVGSNLALRLAREGAKVLAVDSFLPGLGGNEVNLAGASGVQLLRHDISDGAAMENVVRECSVIFNLAGNISHQDSMRDPIFDNEVNTRAQISLLETCRKVNPRAIIAFASTRQLYGAPRYLPVDELHPVSPIDVNGINKLAAENYHTLYSRVYGMKVVCLRLTNTYGPRQLIRHSRQGFIGWFMNRALLSEEIQLFGGGGQVRDFTFVDDACEAFLLAASNPECHGKTFNLSGERASLAEVAEILSSLRPGLKVKKVEFPAEGKSIDIGDYYGNSEKFYAATRWQPRTNLTDGLATSLDYFAPRLGSYLDGAANT